MPILLKVDLILLVFSFMLSSALTLIVFGAGIRQRLNLSFAIYSTCLTTWIISAFMLRQSLWIGPLLPDLALFQYAQFWLEMTAMTMSTLTVAALYFSYVYLNDSPQDYKVWIITGIILLFWIGVPVFKHVMIANPRFSKIGGISEEPMILYKFTFPILIIYTLKTLHLQYRVIREKGEWIIPIAIIIFYTGLFMGGPFDIPFPNLPFTNFISLMLIGYAVVRQQVFNPLYARNRQLAAEIEQRISTEKKLSTSLQEKEVLLQEIHHRVKNNLQIISSLLSLQDRKTDKKEPHTVLKESRSRISSMAMVHEHLYRSDNFSSVNFAEYTQSLLRELFQIYQDNKLPIHFNVEIRNIEFSIERAIPIGLLLNEVLTNIFKYAYPEDFKDKPSVTIRMTREEDNGHFQLIVKDNGIGLPDNFEEKTRDSLGMQIMRMITTHQLGGSMEIKNKKGTQYTFNLPLQDDE